MRFGSVLLALVVACSHPSRVAPNDEGSGGTESVEGSVALTGGAEGSDGHGWGGARQEGGDSAGRAPGGGGPASRAGSNGGSPLGRGGSGASAQGGSVARGGSGALPPVIGGGVSGGATSGGSVDTGGSAGTGGAAQTGGVACADAPGALTPPYPFPQNYRSPYCIYPRGVCAREARTAYEQWKLDLVVAEGAGGFQRVRRPDSENGVVDSTVSEGIAYGMILAVFMDDQSLVDNLFKYSELHLDGNGLMVWLIESSGEPGIEDPTTGRRATGSATDADEDMAWALAMAAQKWGGSGSLRDSYANLARAWIGRIYQFSADTRYTLLNAGDSWGTTFAWNPSYFAPHQYRLFAKLDTANASGWTAIIDKGYEVLAASQNPSGLVPAWTDASGVPTPSWTGGPTHYQYDAARVPFRIAQDYCETGDPRARTILGKLTTFFSAIGATGIVDGYELAGAARPENSSPAGVQSALFVGAAGVGAMSTTQQAFVDSVYARLVTQPASLMLPKSYYYNLSWKVFSLLMMSGNLFDYAQHP
jgi:endo-1,4-beta-D-glucanase Y